MCNRDPFNSVQQSLPDIIIIRPDCNLQFSLIGYDVVLKPCAEATHRYDTCLQRINLTGDQSLKRIDDLCAYDDGVFSHMRRGPMSANAFDRDIDTVHIRQRKA